MVRVICAKGSWKSEKISDTTIKPNYCEDVHEVLVLLRARAVSASLIIEVIKGTRWMPWHAEAMKDV